MPRDITVTFADGTSHTYQGAPDTITPDQVQSRAEKEFTKTVKAIDGGKKAEEKPADQVEPSMMSKIGQGVGDLAAGAVRGAGSIGSTLLELTPVGQVQRYMSGKSLKDSYKERTQAIDSTLSGAGANTDSLPYQGGKLAGEIAGTAGVGGAIANVARGIPVLAKAAPSLINAIGSSGMTAGASSANLATRVAGGSIAGGAQAALANPEDAGMGAAIGGALPIGGALVKGIGTAARKAIGSTTGVGDEALSQAYRAGKEGGKVGETFREGMRGQSSIDDVLSTAKQNIESLGQQKQAAYRSGMVGIKNDKTVLDMSKIGQSADDALQLLSFKGQVKNDKAAKALEGIREEITHWKALNPSEYHTPEGLDALKQKIGGLIEEIPYEQKTARLAAGNVYKAIKNEISTQAPEYSKVMKDYAMATDTVKEIEKALSLGNKSTAESGIRKLQSLMRNNVNTSYGYRGQLADVLEQQGGQELRPALAGQALNDWTPRGLQRAAAGSGGALLALTGNVPAAAGLAAISSPRLMGEALYGAGRAMPGDYLSGLLKGGVYKSAPIAGQQRK